MDANAAHPEAQGPGHYNDPDYLIPMRKLAGRRLRADQEESTTPVRDVGRDGLPADHRLRPAHPAAVDDRHAENPEILAVDQDPLDIQGVRGRHRRAPATSTARCSAGRASARSSCSTAPTQRRQHDRDLRRRGPRRPGRRAGPAGPRRPGYAHRLVHRRPSRRTAPPCSSCPAPTTRPVRALGRLARTTRRWSRTATRTDARSPGAPTARCGSRPARAGALVRRWTDLGGPTGGRILGQPAAYGSRRRPDRRLRPRHRRRRVPQRRSPTAALGPLAAARRQPRRRARPSRTRARRLDAVRARDRTAECSRAPVRLDAAGRARRADRVRAAPSAVARRGGTAPRRRPHERRRGLGAGTRRRRHLVRLDLARRYRQRQPDARRHRRHRAPLRAGRDYTLWQRTYAASGADGWGGWSKDTAWVVSGAFDGALGAAAGPGGQVVAAYRSVAGRVRESDALTRVHPITFKK